MQVKLCPICHERMIIKCSQSIGEIDSNPFYSIYCRCCGYGLKEAFNSRLATIQNWNKTSLSK